jgi:hypothetical protein
MLALDVIFLLCTWHQFLKKFNKLATYKFTAKLARLLEVSGQCNLGCNRNFSSTIAMNLATSGTEVIVTKFQDTYSLQRAL